MFTKDDVFAPLFVLCCLLNGIFSILVVIPIETWHTVAKVSIFVNFVFLFLSIGILAMLIQKRYRKYNSVATSVEIEEEQEEIN